VFSHANKKEQKIRKVLHNGEVQFILSPGLKMRQCSGLSSMIACGKLKLELGDKRNFSERIRVASLYTEKMLSE
jgi:hypothetical protein